MSMMPQNPRPRANLSMANMSNAIATPSTIYDPNWYPDFGATHHMTPDPMNLMDKMDYAGSEKLIVGNGLGMSIHHVGNFSFKLDLSNYSFKLTKLLHVPHISKNLLSVSQFTKDNKVLFEFHPDSCLVKC